LSLLLLLLLLLLVLPHPLEEAREDDGSRSGMMRSVPSRGRGGAAPECCEGVGPGFGRGKKEGGVEVLGR